MNFFFNTTLQLYIRMFHLRFIYFMNDYLQVLMAIMSVHTNVHISICAHMCEMNTKDICSYVHVTCKWVYIYHYLPMSMCVCICL